MRVPKKLRAQVLECLCAARELIQHERNWCQGELVTRGNWFSTSYCLLGALAHSARSSTAVFDVARAALYLQMPRNCKGARFNDTHTHSQVLRCFDRAIKNVRKQL